MDYRNIEIIFVLRGGYALKFTIHEKCDLFSNGHLSFFQRVSRKLFHGSFMMLFSNADA